MHDNPVLLSYVPHGSNPKYFYPINESSPDWEDFCKFRDEFRAKNDADFIVFFNNRNIRRKSPGDVILSYRRFCDGLSKDQAKKCCLILKSAIIDENGTDLQAVKKAICPEYKIIFIPDAIGTQQMNWLYNISSVTIFMSSAEGFGLAANESLLAGTMLIAPVTGGLQDQMRFENESGAWIDVNQSFPTNHRGRYKKHGEWVIPLFPTARVLNGSVQTPFIFDDYTDAEDAATAIRIVYDLSLTERNWRGECGRQWVLSAESGMSSPMMCDRFSTAMNKLFETWIPPGNKWELIEVEERPILKDMGIMWRETKGQ